MLRSNLSSFMKDDLKFVVRNVMSEYLYESVLKCFWKLLSAPITLSRILSRKYSESVMRFHNFLSLHNEQLFIVIKQSIQSF